MCVCTFISVHTSDTQAVIIGNNYNSMCAIICLSNYTNTHITIICDGDKVQLCRSTTAIFVLTRVQDLHMYTPTQKQLTIIIKGICLIMVAHVMELQFRLTHMVA